MARLFVYGTLQHPDVMAAVTGARPRGIAATARGLLRRRVVGESYPGAVEVDGESADGVLYPELDESLLAVLDRFEGEAYVRRRVRVATGDGAETDAWAYVVSPEHRGALSDEPWSYDEFVERHLGAFLAGYDGFGRAGA